MFRPASCNQMGREVLEGLRVSQSQQCPLSRKINKRIIAHPVMSLPSKANLEQAMDKFEPSF